MDKIANTSEAPHAERSPRRPSKALSAAFVRTVAEPGKYFDGNGLFLRVEPTGTKRWVQRIVIRGSRREIGLGSADLISLAQARRDVHENRTIAVRGGDPLQARREAKAVLTFEEAARRVHEIHLPPGAIRSTRRNSSQPWKPTPSRISAGCVSPK